MFKISKYQNIANEIREYIKQGLYKPGQLLPSQKKLSEQFNTSRVTIQHALDELSNDNLIIRKQGSGISVAPNSQVTLDILANQYEGTTSLFKNKGKLNTKILKFDIRLPSTTEQVQLEIKESTPVYDIHRLRIVNDEPYELDYSIIPLSVVSDLTESIALHSIYEYIEESNLQIGSSIRTISADKPSDEDMQFLKCSTNDPILLVSQVVRLKDGRPFEYSHTRHRYDKGGITVINNTLG